MAEDSGPLRVPVLQFDPAAPPKGARRFLGTVLVERGLLSPQRLTAALEVVQQTRRRLGEVLIENQWVFESELAHALAQQNDLPYVDIASRSVDPKAAALLPRDFAEHFLAVPVRVLASGSVLVAAADPGDVDTEVLRIFFGREVELAVGELSAIKRAWQYCS